LCQVFPHKQDSTYKDASDYFKQGEEGIDQAWNRFNELVEQGPRHGFPGDVLLHTFFYSLTPSCMEYIQMCAGGDLMEKTLTEAAQLLQKK
jgi:hypothetical protein